MIEIYLFLPMVVSLLVSLLFIPLWIRKAHQLKLVWKDMNKFSDGKVAGSGGLITVFAFVSGVLLFIAYITFFLNVDSFLIEIFAVFSVVLLAGQIGLIDDLFGWQHGGLPMRTRIILVFLASIPLMAIKAGSSSMFLPFWGLVELGLVYPLIIIPLGVVGATTTYNMLAGFNGLEAGQGILLTVSLGIVATLTGSIWLGVVAFCMAAALVGFMFYNFYPARVFPGDVLTYSVGALLASIAIIGNFEKIAVFFFIPYIIEVILKSRGKLKKHSFGKPNSEGCLDEPYDKIYSLNHLAIRILKNLGLKPTERNAVYLIWIFQIVIILIGLILFKGGIY